jgi:hypothetical protein
MKTVQTAGSLREIHYVATAGSLREIHYVAATGSRREIHYGLCVLSQSATLRAEELRAS